MEDGGTGAQAQSRPPATTTTRSPLLTGRTRLSQPRQGLGSRSVSNPRVPSRHCAGRCEVGPEGLTGARGSLEERWKPWNCRARVRGSPLCRMGVFELHAVYMGSWSILFRRFARGRRFTPSYRQTSDSDIAGRSKPLTLYECDITYITAKSQSNSLPRLPCRSFSPNHARGCIPMGALVFPRPGFDNLVGVFHSRPKQKRGGSVIAAILQVL